MLLTKDNRMRGTFAKKDCTLNCDWISLTKRSGIVGAGFIQTGD